MFIVTERIKSVGRWWIQLEELARMQYLFGRSWQSRTNTL